MNAAAIRDLDVLVAEIRDDLRALGRLVVRLSALQSKIEPLSQPDPADVMAAGAFLHHAYTAMEAIHERIASHVDQARPSGDRWHQDLLTRMGLDLRDVRPAVITDRTRGQLARLLRFRHFFRHAYRIDFLWAEVKPLATDAAEIAAAYTGEIEAFCDHLERSIEAASEG